MEVMGGVTSERAAVTGGGTTGTDSCRSSPRSSLALLGIASRQGTLSQPSSHTAPCIPPGLARKGILVYKKDLNWPKGQHSALTAGCFCVSCCNCNKYYCRFKFVVGECKIMQSL